MATRSAHLWVRVHRTTRAVVLSGAVGAVGAVAAVLTLPGASRGDLYQWVDDRGVTHLSDDASRAPAGVRARSNPCSARVPANWHELPLLQNVEKIFGVHRVLFRKLSGEIVK